MERIEHLTPWCVREDGPNVDGTSKFIVQGSICPSWRVRNVTEDSGLCGYRVIDSTFHLLRIYDKMDRPHIPVNLQPIGQNTLRNGLYWCGLSDWLWYSAQFGLLLSSTFYHHDIPCRQAYNQAGIPHRCTKIELGAKALEPITGTLIVQSSKDICARSAASARAWNKCFCRAVTNAERR